MIAPWYYRLFGPAITDLSLQYGEVIPHRPPYIEGFRHPLIQGAGVLVVWSPQLTPNDEIPLSLVYEERLLLRRVARTSYSH